MSTEVGDEIRKSVMGENIDFENQENVNTHPDMEFVQKIRDAVIYVLAEFVR